MNAEPTSFPKPVPIRKAKRIVVALVGGTVLAAGVALVVLPGPAFLVVPAGLAILAMEFAWARRWLRKVKADLPGTNSLRHPEALSSVPAKVGVDRADARCGDVPASAQADSFRSSLPRMRLPHGVT